MTQQTHSELVGLIWNIANKLRGSYRSPQSEIKKKREAAEVNTYDNFMHFFSKMLENLFIERMEGNEEIFTKLINDDKMMQVAAKQVGKDVYNRVRNF